MLSFTCVPTLCLMEVAIIKKRYIYNPVFSAKKRRGFVFNEEADSIDVKKNNVSKIVFNFGFLVIFATLSVLILNCASTKSDISQTE